MNPLLVIPAKKHSRRLPGKNMLDLCGQPMIQYTIEAAKAAALGRVVVTSDDRAALELAVNLGVDALKEQECHDCHKPMGEVIRKAIIGIEGDPIITLQPTSPLRTAEDIDLCNIHWYLSSVDEEGMNDDWSCASYTEIGKHQELLTTNGAIWITPRQLIEAGKMRAPWPNHLVYWMPPERSVDVDTVADFELCRKLLTLET